MIGVGLSVVGVQQGFALVDDGGAGLPAGAIAYADFKNGTYNYGGNALSDFLTEDTNWGGFNPDTVASDVGLYRQNAAFTSPVIASPLVGELIASGFTFLITFLHTNHANWNVDVFDSPDFAEDVFFNINTNGSSNTGLTADSEVVYSTPPTEAMHKIAMSYIAGHLAMCIDGGSVISQDMATSPSVVNSIGISPPYALETLVVYPAKLDTDLPALCAFDPSLTPQNTVAPELTGTAQEGQTLTFSSGTWSNADSTHIVWSNDSTGLVIGTGSTYVCQASDVGDGLVADVFAENASGTAHYAVASDTVIAA